MTIAILHPNDGSDVRIGKVCRSLSKRGFEVHFIGWDRRPNELKKTDLGTTYSHVMRYETEFGRFTPLGQSRYLLFVVKWLRRIRPKTVCAVNEELAALLVLFKGTLFRHLICDVFDPLVDRHSHQTLLLRCILRLIAVIARIGSDKLIATDGARFDRFGSFRRKAIIIENVPEDPGEKLSRTVPEGPIRIWVAGSLHRHRGLKQILYAVEKVRGVEIASAGWAYDSYARHVFLKHPKVQYMGILTSEAALKGAAQCDAIFSYYAPTSKSNYLASPNKIYDAFAVGRPVIMNSEVLKNSFIKENDLGWVCPYHDVELLTLIVSKLKDRRKDLPGFARRATALFKGENKWSAMERRLTALYASFANE